MQFIRKKFVFPSGRAEWCVSSELGSVSFWVSEHCELLKERFTDEFYGGVEYHYTEKTKPPYMDEAYRHEDCVCNGGVCFHEGTSLWASEHWIPIILPLGDDAIWSELEQNYEKCLGKDSDND